MNPTQAYTDEISQIDTASIERSVYQLSPLQLAWIDYKALGGIVMDKENDKMRKMTVQELADKLGVERKTLYNWRESIPGFWDRVAERRKELNSGEWLALIHEKWKLKALAFDNWPVTEAFLINFDPNYVTPKVKVEHDIGDNYTALLAAAARDNVIDGEVTHATAIDAGASPADQSAHPQAS